MEAQWCLWRAIERTFELPKGPERAMATEQDFRDPFWDPLGGRILFRGGSGSTLFGPFSVFVDRCAHFTQCRHIDEIITKPCETLVLEAQWCLWRATEGTFEPPRGPERAIATEQDFRDPFWDPLGGRILIRGGGPGSPCRERLKCFSTENLPSHASTCRWHGGGSHASIPNRCNLHRIRCPEPSSSRCLKLKFPYRTLVI